MTVLALDLGKHMGYVLGGPVGPVEFGTFDLENTTNLGRFLKSADPFFRKMLPRCNAVAVEKPITAGNSAYFAIRKNFALLGLLHYWSAFYPNVSSITEISVLTGKLTLSGSGRADKDQMIAAAKAWGLEDPDEHSADALGIFCVHVFGARETKAERERAERASRKGRSIL